jgi:hypothetical protein
MTNRKFARRPAGRDRSRRDGSGRAALRAGGQAVRKRSRDHRSGHGCDADSLHRRYRSRRLTRDRPVNCTKIWDTRYPQRLEGNDLS